MSNELIHPTAIIEEGAKIGKNVEIGPFSIIKKDVVIGDNCKIHSHVLIDGHTTIGENNEIYQFSSIGVAPQDFSYKGEPTKTIIGDNNIIREYASIHRGTLKENSVTEVGSNCLLMAYVHLGHDVRIGDRCVIANSTNFAGHVKVGNKVIIGGGSNISQFVTISDGAYLGGASAVDRDIPAFCTAYGNRVRLKGINIIGLRRSGVSRDHISEVVDFYRTMEASHLSPRAFVDDQENLEPFKDNEIVMNMAKLIADSKLGIAPFMS